MSVTSEPERATAHEVAALDLLLEHVDRTRVGAVPDPAEWMAVVGIERLTVESGSTDPGDLRLALQGAESGRVGDLAAEVRERVAAALVRRARGQGVDSGVLNPDAGHHSVTTDARRLRAAVHAAYATFEEVPYYAARYPDRGTRFACSDSAWLAGIATLATEAALGQVTWLTKVLTARGMPSWLMERHLDDLALHLRRWAEEPDPGADPAGSLPAVAAALREQRRSMVPDEVMRAADQEVVDRLGPDRPVRHAGLLLACAVADERSGVARSDAPVIDWLTAPERADALTVSVLHQVRERVRRVAAGG